MADHYGDLNLINGRILNLKVQKINGIPDFFEDDIGKLIFDNVDKSLKFNNGTGYVTIQINNNSQNPLIESLGTKWLNEDLSFNPTPFNNMENISGLTSNNSLFDVIDLLNKAIHSSSSLKFVDLDDVGLTNPTTGDVLIINGEGITNISLTDLVAARLDLSLNDLLDVEIDDSDEGEILFQQNKKFINKKVYHEQTITASNTMHTINHNLGKLYCFTQVINASTGKTINNATIEFIDNNQLVVQLPTPAPVTVIVSMI